MNQQIKFPVFRKYKGGMAYFRIDSAEEFTELKKMGSYYSLSEIKSQHYADRVFIGDLINCVTENIEKSDQSEFEKIRAEWMTSLKRFVI